LDGVQSEIQITSNVCINIDGPRKTGGKKEEDVPNSAQVKGKGRKGDITIEKWTGREESSLDSD